MEHTYFLIGVGIFALAAIVSMVCSGSLAHRLSEVKEDLDEAQRTISSLNGDNDMLERKLTEAYDELLDRNMSISAKAEIEEESCLSGGIFRVIRRGEIGRYIIKTFVYVNSDPDDRDYMRVCAEELVEKLNEES